MLLFSYGKIFAVPPLTFFIFRQKITGKHLYEHAPVNTEAALPKLGVATRIDGASPTRVHKCDCGHLRCQTRYSGTTLTYIPVVLRDLAYLCSREGPGASVNDAGISCSRFTFANFFGTSYFGSLWLVSICELMLDALSNIISNLLTLSIRRHLFSCRRIIHSTVVCVGHNY